DAAHVGRDFLPVAPVALGIFDVADAGVDVEVRGGGSRGCGCAYFGASPLGEDLGVKNIAEVGSLGGIAMAEQKELAGVGGTEVGTAGGFGTAGDLRSLPMRHVPT